MSDRTLIVLAQEQSTPPAGTFKDVEARLEEHTAKINRLIGPYTQGDLNGFTPFDVEIDFADAAGANYDFVNLDKVDIRNVRLLNLGANGANANTVQVKTAAGAQNITDAMSTNGKAAGDLVSCLNLQNRSLAAAAGFRVTTVRAGGVLNFSLMLTLCLRP